MSLGDGPEAQIKFLYLMCNDVEAMRRFYTDVVGLMQPGWKGAGARSFFDEPQWQQDTYWEFPVLDPMENTVEIYATPKEKPESKEWPGSKIP